MKSSMVDALVSKRPSIAYRDGVGWMVKTSYPLDETTMVRIIKWAQEHYTKKLLVMSDGKRKRKLSSIIKELYGRRIIEEITEGGKT